MLGHKQLADLLSHIAIGEIQAALPPVSLHRGAGEYRAVEREICLGNLFREQAGPAAQHMPFCPQFPIIQPVRREQARHMVQEGRHPDNDLVRGALEDSHHQVPHRSRKIRKRGGVIGFHRIPGGDHIPVAGRNILLQGDDPLRGGGIQPQKRQHGAHMLLVGGQGLLVHRLPVVGLIGQAQAGLGQVGDGVIGARILGDIRAHRHVHASATQLHESRNKLINAGHGVDKLQVGVKRCDAGGLNCFGVHERMKQLAGARIWRILHNLINIQLRLVSQLVECAINRAIIGNGVCGKPTFVDKPEQISHQNCHGV